MTQALHIFRKDLRHQSVDLALYIALLVVAGFLIPTGWPGHWSSNAMLPFLRVLVQLAITILWLVIIARAVHEESLPGSRQFWTTRPYRWASLLGAKLLFVIVCIALPYFVMQWCLALYGGVSPWQSGFLMSAAKQVLIMWIPLFLVASITSTFVSTFFTAFAGLIAWSGVLAYFVGSNGPTASAPYAHVYLGVLFAIIFAALLVVLYRTRNVTLGRTLMGFAALAFLVMICAALDMAPTSLGALMLKAQYRNGAYPNVHLHYVPSGKPVPKNVEEGYGRTVITIPIEVLGLAHGDRLHNAAIQYHVQAGALSYTSSWIPTALTEHGMVFPFTFALLRQLGQAEAHFTVSLAADEIAPDTPQTTTIRDHFTIPGSGSCDATNPPYEGRSATTAIACRFAYSVPYPIEINAAMAPGCPIPNIPVQVITREGGTDFDPLIHVPINFGSKTLPPAARGCQVQSLTTTVYHPVAHFRTSLDIPSIRLSDYSGL